MARKRWAVNNLLAVILVSVSFGVRADLSPSEAAFDLAPSGNGVAVASNAQGRTVYLWTQEGLLMGHLFDAQGEPLGEPLALAAGDDAFAYWPAVAVAPNGTFVAIWNRQQPSPFLPLPPSLVAQRFDPSGHPLGDRFEPLDGRGSSGPPAIAMEPSGAFVVAGGGADIDGLAVFLRRYDAVGEPREGFFRADAGNIPFHSQRRFSLAVAPAGNLFVAWATYLCGIESCSQFRVRGRLLDSSGAPLGEPLTITNQGVGVTATWHPTEGFLAVWRRPKLSGLYLADPPEFSVHGRSIGSQGLGPVIDIKAEAGGRFTLGGFSPDVAVDPQGRVVVAWQEGAESGTSSDVFAQALNSRLETVGARLKVELWPGSGNVQPSAAAAGPGEFVVAWTEEQDSGDISLPRAQRFQLIDEGCQPSETKLCLQGGRFEVTGSYRTRSGGPAPGGAGPARFRALSGDSGVTWFFRPENLEGLIKVLDGRSVNGHFWVFFAGLSNLETTFVVRDLHTDRVQVYENSLGDFGSFGDTEAFLESGGEPVAGAVRNGRSRSIFHDTERSPFSMESASGGATPCVPTPQRLCLLGGRFLVEVDQAQTPGGGVVIPALGRPLTDRSGVFWFGSPNNLELMVKVHDGRPSNGRFWVFWGAATNQRYGLRITDTETGAVWSRESPQGEFSAGADTAAF
ncbi:MAG: hypothetical protein K0U98_13925 [Deltaproteobacteria bacterium]|nr:hypothetical protein [Deltaproteobacteria bacterium]